MDLYIQPAASSLEKTATSEVSLPEDANAWPNEIMQELYKQVPYIADFEPNAVMSRVDAEKGYGLGHVEVQNKTELPMGASSDQQRSVGVQQVRIPIIIKNRKLQPLDVLITSDAKSLPLNESRLRQALFRPQAFDVTGRTPGDMSMVGQLYPPYRQNYGFGGGGVGMAGGMGKESAVKKCAKCGSMDKCACGMGKMGSAFEAFLMGPPSAAKYAEATVTTREKTWKEVGTESSENLHHKIQQVLGLGGAPSTTPKTAAVADSHVPNANSHGAKTPKIREIVPKFKTGSILSAILPTINPSDYNAFVSQLQSPGLQASFVKNGYATTAALKKLLEFNPSGPEKTAGVLDQLVRPTIAQIVKEASGYTVKTASHLMWDPRVTVADRGHVVRTFGEKVALAVDTTGSVTLVEGPGVEASPEEDRAEVVRSFGVYKVQTEEGAELKGHVFPNLYDLDGTSIPVALFTDGTHTAVQGEVVGELQTGEQPLKMLFSTPPSGDGVFVRQLEGAAEATVPISIKGSYADHNGSKFHIETFDGQTMFLQVQPNIKKPVIVEDTVLMPAEWRWMPLGQSDDVVLVSSRDGWNAPKQASRSFASVLVRAGGNNTFSFSGNSVEKLAAEERSFLPLDSALFLLGGFGTDLNYASEKLAEAVLTSAPTLVRIGRDIKLASSARRESLEKAASHILDLPTLRCDLVKEAAFIPDPLAVDTVLSLGFVNPENIMTFVAYLPQIEQTQAHLCELLIAARLGTSDVPIGPLEKAIRSIESVVDGLKVLAFEKS